MRVVTAMSWCRLVLLQKGLLHKLKGLPQNLALRPEQVITMDEKKWQKNASTWRYSNCFPLWNACSKVLATSSEVDFRFGSTSKFTKGKRNCSICNRTLGSVLAKINEHPKSVATLLRKKLWQVEQKNWKQIRTKRNHETTINKFKPEHYSNHLKSFKLI